MFNVGQVQSDIDRIDQNTSSINFAKRQKNLGSSKISKDGFLQLMLAQLKQQDPTNPVSDKEFVQQQAALTQIDTLENLTATLKQTNNLSQAANFAGKTVTVKGGDDIEVTGKVTQVGIGKDNFGLQINGKTYTADQIKTIYAVSTP